MSVRPYALASLLSLALLAAGASAQAQPAPAGPAQHAALAPARPGITIQSPATGDTVRGVAIIRFRTENVGIESPFVSKDMHRGLLPAAHLHVTVDGNSWHWVHATTDPVVVTPLTPGEHTVTLELAGADHRPLDVRTVRFTVDGTSAAAPKHAGHR